MVSLAPPPRVRDHRAMSPQDREPQVSSSKGSSVTPQGLPSAAFALLALAVAAYFGAELYIFDGVLAFPLDDSWIHLRFADQLAQGHGLSYDGERPMPGSTAPLWTALLSLGFLFGSGGGAPVVWAKLLGVLFAFLTLVACDRLAGELGLGEGGRRLATLAAAASHWLVWSSLSGMEITLFMALALWGMVLDQRERRDRDRFAWSLPVLALSALARPEGFLLLALAAIGRLLSVRSDADGLGIDLRRPNGSLIMAVGAASLVVLPTLLFNRWAGGSFLPTTFAVKAGSGGSVIPSGQYLRAVVDVFFRAQPWFLLFAAGGAVRLARELGGEVRRSLLPVAWLVGQTLIYAILADPAGPVIVGNFGRYYFPLFPVVAVLGVLGLEGLEGLGPRTRILGWRAPLRALLVLFLLAPQLWALLLGPGRYTQTLANVEDSDVAAARWLARHLDPEALLAVQDIGAIQYFLPNPIVDLTGIVGPEILPVLRGDHDPDVYWEERLARYLGERQPDYLLLFPRSYPVLGGDHPAFPVVRRFPVADNVTMAGPELVVLATPWTRHPLPRGDG